MKLSILLLLPAVAIASTRGNANSEYDAEHLKALVSRRLKKGDNGAGPGAAGPGGAGPGPGAAGPGPGAGPGGKAKGTALPKTFISMAPVPIAPIAPILVPTPSAPTPTAPATPVASPTTAPVAPTPKPVAPTKAPVAPTKAPVAPTKAPVAPTKAPTPVSGPTAAPVKPTTAPVKPITPTTAPVKPTTAPVKPTAAPVPPTIKPTGTPTKAPFSAIALKIAQFLPDGTESYSGPYQGCALSYVESRTDVASLSNAKAVQYYALACIYCATYGVPNQLYGSNVPPHWLKSTNWLSTTADPCNNSTLWYGITCANNKVTIIDFSGPSQAGNNLAGSMPNEVTLLSADNLSGAGNLLYMDLYKNTYLFNEGDAGLAFLGGLGSNMQYLFFGYTSFYYTNGVPPFLANLTNLVEFDCEYTFISGPLKSLPFSAWKQITYITLDGNSYNSTIPSVFGSLSTLTNFYAANAFLSGNLNFMKGMPAIFQLWVDVNSISGQIPTFVGQIQTLVSWSVTENLITGDFPTQVDLMTNMEQMYFFSNKMSGTFPNYLSDLIALTQFSVEDNNLTGNATAFLSALGPPFGVLTKLGIDCATTPPKVAAPAKLISSGVVCCSLSACNDFA